MRIHLEAAPADSDGDELPDTWETHYFGSFLAPGSDGAGDPDSDRMPNRDEYLAGTNPVRASSALTILSLEQSGAELALRFSSVAGWRYQLERAQNLSAAEWVSVGDPIEASGDVTTINMPLSPVEAYFFRVRGLDAAHGPFPPVER